MEFLTDGKILLRILICIVVLITLIGSFIISMRKNNSEVFMNALGGIVCGLVLSYFFGVWSK